MSERATRINMQLQKQPDLQTILNSLTPEGQKIALLGLTNDMNRQEDADKALEDAAFEEVKKRGLEDDFLKLLEQGGSRRAYQRAVVLSEERGDFEAALKYFENTYSRGNTADETRVRSELLRLNLKVAEDYEKQGKLEEAAIHYRNGGNPEKQRELNTTLGERHEQEGNYHKAEDFYSRAGDQRAIILGRKVAEQEEENGSLESAAIEFRSLAFKASDESESSALHARANRLYGEIAQSYENKEDFALAGLSYHDGNNHEKAAECFERAGQLGRAAGEREALGQHERAMILYEQSGNFREAADMATQLGLTEKARTYNLLWHKVSDRVSETIDTHLSD